MQLAISNIINVSISESPAGLGQYNTSNIGLFSTETPANSFGTAGYKAYVDPNDVATDFGTSSKTYEMALASFAQTPNLLAGGGQLIIILIGHATATLTLDAVPDAGTFEVTYKGNNSVPINWDDTAPEIQTKIQAVEGLENVTVAGTISGELLTLHLAGLYGASPTITISNNSLSIGGSTAVGVVYAVTVMGEALAAAISRTKDLVQYFGVMVNATADEIGQTDVLAAAAVIQTLLKMAFFVTYTEANILPGGMLDLLRTGTLTRSRALYYGDDSSNGLEAIRMMAAYVGGGLSVDFSGSNTTTTRNLKDLSTIQPDPSMTQTIYNECKAAGADIYASIQGVPKIISFGANKFFDQVYNLLWFVGAIQIAGFNFLAQTSTKIPQTENGMDGLKGSYRNICEGAVNNAYCAPGVWTNPTTFGNQADLIANVGQRGYYIYSGPIGRQLQSDRALRKAPLVQIAIKEAGAIQESDVIVYVNA